MLERESLFYTSVFTHTSDCTSAKAGLVQSPQFPILKSAYFVSASYVLIIVLRVCSSGKALLRWYGPSSVVRFKPLDVRGYLRLHDSETPANFCEISEVFPPETVGAKFQCRARVFS